MRPAVRWWNREYVILIRWGGLCHPLHISSWSVTGSTTSRGRLTCTVRHCTEDTGQVRVPPNPADTAEGTGPTDTEEGICRAAAEHERTSVQWVNYSS